VRKKTAGVLTLEKLQEVAKEIDSILELAIPMKKVERKKNPRFLKPCRTQYGMNYATIYEAAKHLGLSSEAIYRSIVTGKCLGQWVWYRSDVNETCFL
jgi:hypothetical protein